MVGLVWRPWACFPGTMTTKERIDAYVSRIKQVKEELEANQWFPIRHDEWSSPNGDTLRFSYSHTEFHIHSKYIGRAEEHHIVRVRPADEAHVPTVNEILYDILDLGLSAWSLNRKAIVTGSNGAVGVASSPKA